MMDMHSMTFLFMALMVAIVVIGGIYVAVRLVGARIVESDHPKRDRDRT